MNSITHTSTADVADRHRLYFALALLAVGLIYLGKAFEPLASEPIQGYLEYAILALAIATIAALAPSVVAKIRLPRNQKLVYFSEDGYVADLLRSSFKISWGTTFIGLVLLEILLPNFLADYSATFLIRIALFIMLTSMSTTFIFLNWRASAE